MPISFQHLPESITTNADLAPLLERCASGRLDGVEDELAERMKTSPHTAAARHLLAIVKFESGARNEALEQIDRLMTESEHDASLHNTLGHMFLDMEMIPEAEAAYQQALDVVPHDFEALWNLGNLMQLVDRRQDAERLYREATLHHPEKGLGHLSLGSLLLARGQPEDARISLERAAALMPDHIGALNNLGIALMSCGRVEEATAALRNALSVQPGEPTVLYHLGRLLSQSGETSEAEQMLRRAMALDSDNPLPAGSLADLFVGEGRLDEAASLLMSAVQRFPQDGMTHMQLGLLQLRQGAFAQGWLNFEGRRPPPALRRHLATRPLWKGEILDGKTLLVTSEGSLGDVIQFLRYLESPIRLGRDVVLEVPDPFVPLLRANRLGLRIVAESAGEVGFDYVTRIMSLPLLTGQTAQFWPQTGPYLRADPALVREWRDRLGRAAGRQIALAVSDGMGLRTGLPIDLLGTILEQQDLEVVCLATGRTADTIADRDWAQRLRIVENEVEPERFFEHAAAIIEVCGLLVGTDGDMTHLAGALGKDAWIMLDPAGNWRWGETGENTPLYPNHRLFREARAQGWDGAVRALSKALAVWQDGP